jgi:hypothetical protein
MLRWFPSSNMALMQTSWLKLVKIIPLLRRPLNYFPPEISKLTKNYAEKIPPFLKHIFLTTLMSSVSYCAPPNPTPSKIKYLALFSHFVGLKTSHSSLLLVFFSCLHFFYFLLLLSKSVAICGSYILVVPTFVYINRYILNLYSHKFSFDFSYQLSQNNTKYGSFHIYGSTFIYTFKLRVKLRWNNHSLS